MHRVVFKALVSIKLVLLSYYWVMLVLSFERDFPETKFQKISQFEKATVQIFTAGFWAVIPNQMIRYQLPNTWLNHISDQQYGIYLYVKLCSKLLMQTANKNTKFTFMETRPLRFSLVWIRKRNQKTLNKCNICRLKEYLHHQFWPFVNLLFLVKKIILGDFY